MKPAGKRIEALSLLSGGEKALTAIAFLFALLLTKPSPFYVLDEVEAALDDANIERFLDLLRAYQERAQFIVITHQRRTMEVADVLYGVDDGRRRRVEGALAPGRPRRRAAPGSGCLDRVALHQPLVVAEAEPGVQRPSIARVQDPAAIGKRAVLDDLADERQAETGRRDARRARRRRPGTRSGPPRSRPRGRTRPAGPRGRGRRRARWRRSARPGARGCGRAPSRSSSGRRAPQRGRAGRGRRRARSRCRGRGSPAGRREPCPQVVGDRDGAPLQRLVEPPAAVVAGDAPVARRRGAAAPPGRPAAAPAGRPPRSRRCPRARRRAARPTTASANPL